MKSDLRTALCRSATARAHLYGAEAAELEALTVSQVGLTHHVQEVRSRASAARRRYWRECEAAQLLLGHRWPEAEALGRNVQ